MISAASHDAAIRIAKHTLPLGLKSGSDDFPWDGAKRGTFTLLKLPRRHVFVTCCHVLNMLREMQIQNPSAEMVAYLTSAKHLTELNGFELIDKERRSLDVAIFRGLEDFVELPGMQFIDYTSSYLSDPIEGEPVAIVGYPGANVSVSRENADFGFMHIVVRASSISERQIVLANENGDRRFIDYNDPACLGVDLGGLSGSPAFVIREHQHRFIGIVTDCSEREQTILISRLGCLNPDGTLDHTSIPW